MSRSKITSASIEDSTIAAADIASGAVEGAIATPLSHRNLIINGAMQVAQRGTSATTVSGAGVYNTLDRWKLWEATTGNFTTEQSSEAPDGFGSSIKCAVTTAETDLTTDRYACIGNIIEGQDLQHLGYGTSFAKNLTLSFWVRSSKTGTYSICLDKENSTTYKYVKEYTILSADTWEKKTITIEPDSNIQASGGAINNDNGKGFRLFFSFAWGSNYNTATDNTWNNSSQFTTTNQVNWMDSTSNDFYLTGVQLEVGSVATPFEHRSYGEELARCQRYYCHSYREGFYPGDNSSPTPIGETSPGSNSFHSLGQFYFPTQMRTTPTITIYNPITGVVGSFRGDSGNYSGAVSHSFTEKGVRFYANGTGATTNVFCFLHVEAEAEL